MEKREIRIKKKILKNKYKKKEDKCNENQIKIVTN